MGVDFRLLSGNPSLGVPSKKNSIFKDIVQIGGREVNPISKKSKEMNFWHFFGIGCIFFKTDFCVETVSPSRSIWIPWTLQSEQIFFSLIKGSEPPLGLPVAIVPDHLESWNFFWYLLWPILMGKCRELIQIQKFCFFERPYSTCITNYFWIHFSHVCFYICYSAS